MAVLTVASRANGAIIFPAMLAASYATLTNLHEDIVVECKDMASLGKEDQKMVLTMKNGDVLVDRSVIQFLVDQTVLPTGTKRNQVGWGPTRLISFLIDASLGRRVAAALCRSYYL